MDNDKDQVEAIIGAIALLIAITQAILPILYKRIICGNEFDDFKEYMLNITKSYFHQNEKILHVHEFPKPTLQLFILSLLLSFPIVLVLYSIAYKGTSVYGIFYCLILCFVYIVYFSIYFLPIFGILIITDKNLYTSTLLFRNKVVKYNIENIYRFEIVKMLQTRACRMLDRVKMILDDGRMINFWYFGSNSVDHINKTIEITKSKI